VKKVAELQVRHNFMLHKPELVVVTETWNDSASVVPLREGSCVIARRVRSDGRQGGGVLVYALIELSESAGIVGKSTESQRV